MFINYTIETTLVGRTVLCKQQKGLLKLYFGRGGGFDSKTLDRRVVGHGFIGDGFRLILPLCVLNRDTKYITCDICGLVAHQCGYPPGKSIKNQGP